MSGQVKLSYQELHEGPGRKKSGNSRSRGKTFFVQRSLRNYRKFNHSWYLAVSGESTGNFPNIISWVQSWQLYKFGASIRATRLGQLDWGNWSETHRTWTSQVSSSDLISLSKSLPSQAQQRNVPSILIGLLKKKKHNTQ